MRKQKAIENEMAKTNADAITAANEAAAKQKAVEEEMARKNAAAAAAAIAHERQAGESMKAGAMRSASEAAAQRNEQADELLEDVRT